MPTDPLSATFAALADPTRRAILARLALGETSVSELAKPFDISGPADIAWNLHRAWPASRLTIIDDEGHGGPNMLGAFEAAIASMGPAESGT